MAGFLDRASPPHILTLVMATSLSSLATNVFLPSLPGIARHFETDYALAQLTVSIYLAATAVLQLSIGPASDRFGRRPVMLVCLGIYMLGSVAAIFAPTIELLLAGRILQAFSAAGMVLARAIVRDTVASDDAASRIGYITMGMAMVPMAAPLLGGLLDEIYGWRAAFVVMLVVGLAAFLLVLFDLGETNRNASASLVAQMRAYPGLLKSPRFWGYALSGAFCTAVFFAVVGAGPFVATELLGLKPSVYGFYFGLLSVGYVFGNFLSGRYSRRVGLDTMMLGGNIMLVIGSALPLVLFWLGLGGALSLFGPLVFVGIGNGMTLPNAAAGVVDVRPELAGSASGLAGSLQLGIAALVSALAGVIVTAETGAVALLLIMLTAGIAAVLVSLPLAYRKGR